MSRRVRLVVSGRVQGVWFRASTREQARRLELSGWVRNLDDGRVEVVAEGEAERVADLAAWCRVGPPGARVDALTEQELAAAGEPLPGFEIRY